MATNLRAKIQELITLLNHYCEDDRYMGAHDLATELDAGILRFTDFATQKTLYNGLIKMLEDTSVDCQTVAVRCLLAYVRNAEPRQIADILLKLAELVVDPSKVETRDVFASGLRMILDKLTPNIQFDATVPAELFTRLTQTLNGLRLDTMQEIDLAGLCLDLIGDIAAHDSLGSPREMLGSLLHLALKFIQMASTQDGLARKAVRCLGSFAKNAPAETLAEYVAQPCEALLRICSSTDMMETEEVRSHVLIRMIQGISSICRNSQAAMTPSMVNAVLPVLTACLSACCELAPVVHAGVQNVSLNTRSLWEDTAEFSFHNRILSRLSLDLSHGRFEEYDVVDLAEDALNGLTAITRCIVQQHRGTKDQDNDDTAIALAILDATTNFLVETLPPREKKVSGGQNALIQRLMAESAEENVASMAHTSSSLQDLSQLLSNTRKLYDKAGRKFRAVLHGTTQNSVEMRSSMGLGVSEATGDDWGELEWDFDFVDSDPTVSLISKELESSFDMHTSDPAAIQAQEADPSDAIVTTKFVSEPDLFASARIAAVRCIASLIFARPSILEHRKELGTEAATTAAATSAADMASRDILSQLITAATAAAKAERVPKVRVAILSLIGDIATVARSLATIAPNESDVPTIGQFSVDKAALLGSHAASARTGELTASGTNSQSGLHDEYEVQQEIFELLMSSSSSSGSTSTEHMDMTDLLIDAATPILNSLVARSEGEAPTPSQGSRFQAMWKPREVAIADHSHNASSEANSTTAASGVAVPSPRECNSLNPVNMLFASLVPILSDTILASIGYLAGHMPCQSTASDDTEAICAPVSTAAELFAKSMALTGRRLACSDLLVQSLRLITRMAALSPKLAQKYSHTLLELVVLPTAAFSAVSAAVDVKAMAKASSPVDPSKLILSWIEPTTELSLAQAEALVALVGCVPISRACVTEETLAASRPFLSAPLSDPGKLSVGLCVALLTRLGRSSSATVRVASLTAASALVGLMPTIREIPAAHAIQHLNETATTNASAWELICRAELEEEEKYDTQHDVNCVPSTVRVLVSMAATALGNTSTLSGGSTCQPTFQRVSSADVRNAGITLARALLSQFAVPLAYCLAHPARQLLMSIANRLDDDLSGTVALHALSSLSQELSTLPMRRHAGNGADDFACPHESPETANQEALALSWAGALETTVSLLTPHLKRALLATSQGSTRALSPAPALRLLAGCIRIFGWLSSHRMLSDQTLIARRVAGVWDQSTEEKVKSLLCTALHGISRNLLTLQRPQAGTDTKGTDALDVSSQATSDHVQDALAILPWVLEVLTLALKVPALNVSLGHSGLDHALGLTAIALNIGDVPTATLKGIADIWLLSGMGSETSPAELTADRISKLMRVSIGLNNRKRGHEQVIQDESPKDVFGEITACVTTPTLSKALLSHAMTVHSEPATTYVLARLLLQQLLTSTKSDFPQVPRVVSTFIRAVLALLRVPSETIQQFEYQSDENAMDAHHGSIAAHERRLYEVLTQDSSHEEDRPASSTANPEERRRATALSKATLIVEALAPLGAILGIVRMAAVSGGNSHATDQALSILLKGLYSLAFPQCCEGMSNIVLPARVRYMAALSLGRCLSTGICTQGHADSTETLLKIMADTCRQLSDESLINPSPIDLILSLVVIRATIECQTIAAALRGNLGLSGDHQELHMKVVEGILQLVDTALQPNILNRFWSTHSLSSSSKTSADKDDSNMGVDPVPTQSQPSSSQESIEATRASFVATFRNKLAALFGALISIAPNSFFAKCEAISSTNSIEETSAADPYQIRKDLFVPESLMFAGLSLNASILVFSRQWAVVRKHVPHASFAAFRPVALDLISQRKRLGKVLTSPSVLALFATNSPDAQRATSELVSVLCRSAPVILNQRVVNPGDNSASQTLGEILLPQLARAVERTSGHLRRLSLGPFSTEVDVGVNARVAAVRAVTDLVRLSGSGSRSGGRGATTLRLSINPSLVQETLTRALVDPNADIQIAGYELLSELVAAQPRSAPRILDALVPSLLTGIKGQLEIAKGNVPGQTVGPAPTDQSAGEIPPETRLQMERAQSVLRAAVVALHAANSLPSTGEMCTQFPTFYLRVLKTPRLALLMDEIFGTSASSTSSSTSVPTTIPASVTKAY